MIYSLRYFINKVFNVAKIQRLNVDLLFINLNAELVFNYYNEISYCSRREKRSILMDAGTQKVMMVIFLFYIQTCKARIYPRLLKIRYLYVCPRCVGRCTECRCLQILKGLVQERTWQLFVFQCAYKFKLIVEFQPSKHKNDGLLCRCHASITFPINATFHSVPIIATWIIHS